MPPQHITRKIERLLDEYGTSYERLFCGGAQEKTLQRSLGGGGPRLMDGGSATLVAFLEAPEYNKEFENVSAVPSA